MLGGSLVLAAQKTAKTGLPGLVVVVLLVVSLVFPGVVVRIAQKFSIFRWFMGVLVV
jgi:uncharacterized membrane protein